MLLLIALIAWCIHDGKSVKVHPRYPLATQPSWQASVPVPIDITYDVPTALEFDEESTPLIDPGAATNQSETRLENSSFALPPERLIAQAVIPEQFSIRLHPPTESTQQSLDGVAAVAQLWSEDVKESRERYQASREQLLNAIAMNVRRIVTQSMSRLASLRNPLT